MSSLPDEAAPQNLAARSGRRIGDRTALLAIAGGCTLYAALFTRLMTFDLRRDEELYATPAVLLKKLDLYRDFFYNHTPITAWLFRVLKIISGTDHILLVGRIGVFLGWVLIGAGVAWVTYKLTKSRAMAIFLVLAVALNDTLLNQTGMAATNNFLPWPFAYVGLALFVFGTSKGRLRPLLIGASGLMLAIAVGMKVSGAAFVLPALIAMLVMPPKLPLATRLTHVVAPLAAGGLIGSIPVMIYLAEGPQRFLAHIIGFHTGPHVAYWHAHAAEEPVAFSLAARFQLAYETWLGPANSILLLCLLVIVVLLTMHRRDAREARRTILNAPIIFALASLVVVAAMTFLPEPGFPQYYVPPLFCAILLAPLLYTALDADGRNRIAPVLIAGSIVLVLLQAPRLGQDMARLPHPGSWTVNKVHNAGVAIAKALESRSLSGRVATLDPIYPIEGGLAVYPELATGQFAYRTADFTKPSLAKYYRSTSPETIEALFDKDPPAAILVGFDPALDAPMVRYASAHGYERVPGFSIADREGTGVLYCAPHH